MTAKDIKVGSTYVIRHHGGQLCAVRVEAILHKESLGGRSATRYSCTKLSTGNVITIKSASKFRREYMPTYVPTEPEEM